MKKSALMMAIMLAGSGLTAGLAQADDNLDNFIKEGKVLGDLRLRYEQNDVDNSGKKTAEALTLRSRVGLQSGQVYGFSGLVEGSYSAPLVDHYTPENTDYDAVGDPEHGMLNRLQLNYKNAGLDATVGRQRIILDNARMVGNVGWRQQEQVYDAARLAYKINDLKFDYSYINKVHTPNFDHNDTAHHLLNVNYSGLKFLSVTAYSYLLKDKENNDAKTDTYGVRLAGKQALDSLEVLYSGGYAYQKTDDFNASYFALEGGVMISGVTAAVGYESLGSDNQKYGFQTPLATKHAFNGWADKFVSTPNEGLNDLYVKLGAKVQDVQLLAFYHDYRSDKGSLDLGKEIDLQASYDFAKYYSVGAKYAMYQKCERFTDNDKFWAWLEVKF